MRTILTWLLMALLPAAGWASGCMPFDGADDLINCGTGLSMGSSTQVTVSAWYKATLDVNDFLFQRSASSKGFSLRIDEANANNLEFYIGKGSAYTFFTYPHGMSNGLWYHIVATYNGVKGECFVNAISIGSTAVAFTPDWNNGGITAYISAPNAGEWLHGSIDEVLIYNVALTAPEIQAMYASGGAWRPYDGDSSKQVLYIPFDHEGLSSGNAAPNGFVFHDRSGNGNHGTVSDGADNSMTLQSSPVRERRGRR